MLISCNGTTPEDFVRYTTDLQIESKILGMPIKYSVFLPADYADNPKKRYPVVYLLHGLGDDHNSWNDKWLNIASRIENWEVNGGLEPMIYIMPQGFRSYYVNRYDGRYNYMDMFIQELVPQMDAKYRTVADAGHRAVVGYSMGGFGAMILAAKNPDVFSVSVPLSMSFRTDEQYTTESAGAWDNQWGAIFGGRGTTGEARLTNYYKQHCPFYMFTEQNISQYSSVKYFYDCGDDEEQLLVANDNLHVQLRDIGFTHEFRVRNGGHTSQYWASAMQEALPFIVSCFNGIPYRTEEEIIPSDTLELPYKDTLLNGVPVTLNGITYLIDAVIDTTTLSPEKSYYITLGDNGANYKNANAVYRICKKRKIPFEYRIYNGTASRNSLLYGLKQIKIK